MPPPSTDDIEITNYDVLADEVSNPISSGESEVGLSLAAHSYHVGNNRLEVLCNIQAQTFNDLLAKKDESGSSALVERIMNIVQNQCVPKGRFLERSTKGEWKEVETEKARLLVRQALENQGTATTTTRPGAAKKEEEAEAAEIQQKKKESDAEKKRRRRSSLLRRSVSSSMLPNFGDLGMAGLGGKPFDDKKKSTRREISPQPSPANSRASSPVPPADRSGPRPAFGRSQSVDMGQAIRAKRDRRLAVSNALEANPLLVSEPMKMDVLLNTAKTALLPGTDLHGNNRLRVMVQIQTGGYQGADEETQTKMAESLLNTIESFWGGRILSKVPSRNKSAGDSFLKLDKDHSISAMKNLLSGKAAEQEEEATIGEAPDPKIKQGRRASLKAIQSIASSGATGSSASILPSSLPALPADMQHLRSAAVKSLQKRKQRQGLNSRIRGLTADKAAVFQDGSSNASVMSSSVAPGKTSPIPTKLGSPVPSASKVISNMPSHAMPHIQQYRQTSSGASVASTASQMSTANSYYPPPGNFQRQGSISNASVGGMSTGSSNTQMTMNTMNAARTMAAINLGGRQNQMMHPGMMQPSGMGGPMLGSELQIPATVMNAQQQQHMAAQQQQMAAQFQQMAPQQMMPQMPAYQQRASVVMSCVPEEVFNAAAAAPYSPPPLTADQLSQLNQGLSPDPYDGGIQGVRAGPQDRTSLLNSTGSDGLPKFAQGEMELLIKGLEMQENQAQHPGQGH
ncbi:expressed unknown protein [Seminavis robusta]|uniref:DUF6824 domain-containing protein n=1 Tax=Seminavis robusta TaxID=568900 RepID=A0A9N8HVR5_9STRA|nr:expressed unknown protein [Seminavis robusta]|eukprot:Sro1853_g301820.1 n/a (740) ;mRNA; f:17200-19419